MQQLTLSGHACYCVVRAAQILHQSQPNLPRIHLVLRNAYFTRSDEAMYFLLMLKVLVSEGFDRNRVLSIFNGLFVRQRLAHCRDAISVNDLLFYCSQLELRLMHPVLDYKFTCLSKGACALSNRIRITHLPSRGADEDYDMLTFVFSAVSTSNSPGS